MFATMSYLSFNFFETVAHPSKGLLLTSVLSIRHAPVTTASLLSVRWGLKCEAHVFQVGDPCLVFLEIRISQVLQRKMCEFRLTENIDTCVLMGQKENKLV